MSQSQVKFNSIAYEVGQALPESFEDEGDVEQYHRRFVDEDENITVSLLWLESDKIWFEIDLYVEGKIQGSASAQSKEELLDLVENYEDLL